MAYDAFVESGDASVHLDWLRNEQGMWKPEPPEGWTMAQQEVRLHAYCLEMHNAERKAYDRFKSGHEDWAPQFVAAVALRTPNHSADDSKAHFLHYQGFPGGKISDVLTYRCQRQ